MIEWNQVSGFQWDSGNARKSLDKHTVSPAEAEQVFFNQPLLLILDDKHSKQEARYHVLGVTDTDRRLHITFTLRREDEQLKIRVISARDMHRKERLIYEQAE